jgi:P2-related tail formation protein
MIISKESFAQYVYNLMPEIYRTEDAKHSYVLKKYIDAVIEGGYGHLVEKLNSFTGITNAETCPENLFPYLFESRGLTYQKSINIKYQRKILANLGELNKRRGTYASIRYLVKALTNLEIEMENEKLSSGGHITTRNLHIRLLVDSLKQVVDMENSVLVVQNYIKSQVPYNITPLVVAAVKVQVLENEMYRGTAISYGKSYVLTPSNL